MRNFAFIYRKKVSMIGFTMFMDVPSETSAQQGENEMKYCSNREML